MNILKFDEEIRSSMSDIDKLLKQARAEVLKEIAIPKKIRKFCKIKNGNIILKNHKKPNWKQMKENQMKDFKDKYFFNNIYWINQSNHKLLQKIALEVGCLCHTGKKEIIKWHEGFNILGFRTYPQHNNITMFQKEPFVMATEIVTDFAEMFIDYKKFLTTKQNQNEQIEI